MKCPSRSHGERRPTAILLDMTQTYRPEPPNRTGLVCAACQQPIATVGYILTLKPLDAHIRTANPYGMAWVAALICYPPFILMNGGPLDYQVGGADWGYWLAGHDTLMAVWGALLVGLIGVYAWATMAFGIRFSNLTHRGVITHGPYALTRHPAYISKNLSWWVGSLPFLVTSGGWVEGARGADAIAHARLLAGHGIVRFAMTAVARDGTLEGPDLALLEAVAAAVPRAAIIASGGIGHLEDIEELARRGYEAAILGRALYEGAFDLPAAVRAAQRGAA